ncbi:MAG: hypothetical protein ACYCSW_11350 [bacterium]
MKAEKPGRTALDAAVPSGFLRIFSAGIMFGILIVFTFLFNVNKLFYKARYVP